jgi:hypothetical protein
MPRFRLGLGQRTMHPGELELKETVGSGRAAAREKRQSHAPEPEPAARAWPRPEVRGTVRRHHAIDACHDAEPAARAWQHEAVDGGLPGDFSDFLQVS